MPRAKKISAACRSVAGTEGTCSVAVLSPSGFSQFGVVALAEDIRTPVAGFSAEPTQGFPPLTVEFIDESQYQPLSWDWDFGDEGPHSEEQHPSHIYAKPGTYAVSLTATNSAGSSTLMRDLLIVVERVQADLDADGKVNELDIELMASALGSPNSGAAFVETADLNGDGVVDLRDIARYGALLSPEKNQ